MSSTRIIATGSTSTNHYFLVPSLTDTQLRNALNQRQGKRVNASPTPLPDLHVLKVFGKQRKKYTLPFKIVKLIIVQSDMWPPPVWIVRILSGFINLFQLIMKMGNNWCVSSLPSSVPWLWTIPRRTDWVIVRTPKVGTVRYPQQDRTLQLLPIFETPAITARKHIYFITHWSTIHPSS